jgi:hypothetical protein
MRVAVVGVGKIGGTLGRLWAAAGHEVVFTFSRDEGKLAQVAAEAAGEAAAPKDAVRGADATLLAVPWAAIDDALSALGPLEGATLIDATNYGGEPSGLSGAEKIAARAAGARVVKAINTVFAPMYPEAAKRPGVAHMLVAGDDASAKETVSTLVRDLGFEPIDAGPLTSARGLEAMAELVIDLAYRQGRGPFAYRFAPVDDV